MSIVISILQPKKRNKKIESKHGGIESLYDSNKNYIPLEYTETTIEHSNKEIAEKFGHLAFEQERKYFDFHSNKYTKKTFTYIQCKQIGFWQDGFGGKKFWKKYTYPNNKSIQFLTKKDFKEFWKKYWPEHNWSKFERECLSKFDNKIMFIDIDY